MGLFTHAVLALTAVYGLSYGCNQIKESLKPAPYLAGTQIDDSKEYTVWKGSTKMTLPGYELRRRPHDMSIDECLGRTKH